MSTCSFVHPSTYRVFIWDHTYSVDKGGIVDIVVGEFSSVIVRIFMLFPQNPSQVSVALQVFYNLGQLPVTLLSIIGGFREAIQHDIQNALDPATLIQGVEGTCMFVCFFQMCSCSCPFFTQ